MRELRKSGTLAYYTMDAGPHVKVLVRAADAAEVTRALEAVPGVERTIHCGPGGDAEAEESAVRAGAPGKVVISGAYAVLEGAPAVVSAVSRYAWADARRTADFVTPEVKAALGDGPAPWFDASALRGRTRQARARLERGHPGRVPRRPRALDTASWPTRRWLQSVLERALAAHRAAQRRRQRHRRRGQRARRNA